MNVPMITTSKIKITNSDSASFMDTPTPKMENISSSAKCTHCSQYTARKQCGPSILLVGPERPLPTNSCIAGKIPQAKARCNRICVGSVTSDSLPIVEIFISFL